MRADLIAVPTGPVERKGRTGSRAGKAEIDEVACLR